MDFQSSPIVVTATGERTFRVAISGPIHTNVAWLENELQRIAEGKPARVELDMAGTSFLSSTGVGVLVSFHRHVSEAGGVVQIVAADKNVYSTLRFARLDKVFGIAPSAITQGK